MSGTGTFAIVPQVLQIWEIFFLPSGVFYITLLPHIYHNLLLSRLLWELAVLPWRFQGLPLKLETQTRPICLFETHSVQEKVLVGRFYLCVKTLWNTIWTSSRFWTNSLTATYIVKCRSYPLGHRSAQGNSNPSNF